MLSQDETQFIILGLKEIINQILLKHLNAAPMLTAQ